MQSRPDYTELLKLPPAERLQLIEDLWESLADSSLEEPLHPAILEELRDRLARYDADPSTAISWDEVKRRLREDR
ncbi:addiction module protein [Aquincola sp. MAHUQ-54]|uniref:Addiction module protein n=1 Tax=Aquincola agrisoli TaxID=3119538 RepID=A0AAW9QCE0_9BURK